jgi:pimeloyl-ACP methyl ester carboxylesterase
VHTSVLTTGGVRLTVREAGPPEAQPVVLVHGWAQSGAVWDVEGYRTYAVDLRGHGDSDEPADGYRDSVTWADDLATVLRHVGRPAVLVGWSYGGLVIMDYLRSYGTSQVSGIVLVSAITEIGRGRPGGATGSVMKAALPAALTDDHALAEFCAAMAPALPVRTVQQLTAASLRVSPHVRAELFRRDVDSADVLAAIDVPTVVLHGTDDQVVAPAAAEYAAARIPGAELVWYADTAHVPFLEQPERFAADLAKVVR